ncbi:hypothetical protein P885DRAFT_62972 [Corynascus similis CBS 632.67]
MPSLGQLPTELLDMIVGRFCQHCTLLEYDCDDPYPWHKEHGNFATSVTPLSLHEQRLQTSASPASGSTYLYDYFQDDTFDALLKDGVFPSAPEIARHFDTSRLARMTLGEEDIPDHPPIREAWDFLSWENAESLDMLVLLCPNVRHISMGPICLPGPFTYSNSRSLMQVELVEIGRNLNRYSTDVDMLTRIAAVAPHITSLALARLLDACPNLRLLVYESLVKRWQPPTSEASYEIQGVVARYAPTLISLNIYSLDGVIGSSDPRSRHMLFFDVLPTSICLVRIIWSLAEFSRELKPMFRSLMHLASLLPKRFSRLKSVTTWGLDPEGVPVEEIVAAFETHGVVFQVQYPVEEEEEQEEEEEEEEEGKEGGDEV